MNDVSLITSWLRLIVAFPLVIGLAVLTIRLGGRLQSGMQRTPNMEVVDRLGLGKHFSLMIVRVGEEFHLMSTTEQEIRLLKVLDFEPMREETVGTADFRAILTENMRKIGWKSP